MMLCNSAIGPLTLARRFGMRNPATMLGVAAAGAIVAYGAYSYLQQRKEKEIKKIIDDMMDEIENADVFICDPVGLREKLKVILEGGAAKMQCISDFDGTITKGMCNGEKAQSSFAVISYSRMLPEDVVKKDLELREKYYPIERSSNKTEKEKCQAMEEWFGGVFEAFKEGGLKKQMIPEMVSKGNSILREGGLYFLQKLHDEEIPVLIFSAGVGDIVQEVFTQQYSSSPTEGYDNMEIVSNFIKWDNEGKMEGVIGELLHSSNKGDIAASLNYKDTVKGRTNILLLGDNAGDLEMIKAAENVCTCLKIGFLNDNVNELKKDFEQMYDIVIVDPESMVLVGVLLIKLLDRK